jgi:hypothetical protein
LLFAALLGAIALVQSGDAPQAGPPAAEPVMRHYDPLMTW